MSGYEIVQDELYTSTGGRVAKTVTAPTGKVVVGGGFRFVYDGGSFTTGVLVNECGPYAGAFGDGTKWYADVVASGAGTLRVMAVCVDA